MAILIEEHPAAPDTLSDSRRRWVEAAERFTNSDLANSGGLTQRVAVARTEDHYAPQIEPTAQKATHFDQRTATRLGLYALTGLVGVLLIYALVSTIAGWTRVTLDDLRYGRPRTTHLDAFVGHSGESTGVPTHFIAMNLDRRITLIEFPGGNATSATTINGPYLFGAGEELTPVDLSVTDLNGDGDPDILLSVRDEQVAYINERTKSTFRAMTVDELAALTNSMARGGSAPGMVVP